MNDSAKRLLFVFAAVNAALNIFMFILVLLPRERTRHIRHTLARAVMLLWVGSSRVWAMFHEDLWQRGNGH